MPLSAVAELISKEAVLRGIRLTDDSLREAGFERPRIAVAGLNPHAGDGGNFGREEIDVIEPAVEAAKQEGINADGPYPPDTVFVRASKGAFDAVLTMYHDQGQIAMKLLGFDRGVTLLVGSSSPCARQHMARPTTSPARVLPTRVPPAPPSCSRPRWLRGKCSLPRPAEIAQGRWPRAHQEGARPSPRSLIMDNPA